MGSGPGLGGMVSIAADRPLFKTFESNTKDRPLRVRPNTYYVYLERKENKTPMICFFILAIGLAVLLS